MIIGICFKSCVLGTASSGNRDFSSSLTGFKQELLLIYCERPQGCFRGLFRHPRLWEVRGLAQTAPRGEGGHSASNPSSLASICWSTRSLLLLVVSMYPSSFSCVPSVFHTHVILSSVWSPVLAPLTKAPHLHESLSRNC